MSEETKDSGVLYYGNDKITNVEDDTTEGFKRVTIEFEKPVKNEDGTEDTRESFSIPEWELKASTSQEKANYSDVVNGRINYVASKLMDLLEELDFRIEEFPVLVDKMLNSFRQMEDNVELKNYGISHKRELRLSHWNSVLEA